jgi:subtilisin family serine protease
MRTQFRLWIAPAVVGIALVAAPLAVAVATPAHTSNSSASRTYLILYSGQADAPRAQSTITALGASTIAVYSNLGIAFARSRDESFTRRMRLLPGVIGVTPTDKHVWHLPKNDGLQDSRGPADETPTVQESEVGSLTAKQWDMKQIHAVEAHLVNPGSSKIVVGVIDTGIDYTHPNLAPNIDFSKSVSCIGGTANTSPSAWDDDRGHGTHVAGTIAATSEEADHLGVDGVAPGVRLAAIKTGDANGDFFLEAVVCAFTWAADHHINVTNNSYFSDPWLYHCLSDPDQRAIWVAEKRALDYSASKGVVNVAAAGNYNDDLANPTIDTISPDVPPGAAVFREVGDDCFTFPSMAPGVITVSSVGMTAQKSYYSSFGTGIVKVTAPGGDFRVTSAENPNGRILSTYPGKFPRVTDCNPDGKCANYAWLQGTSMASPHAAGVIALILSRHDSDDLSPAQALSRLTSTSDPLACPPDPYYPAFLSPNMPRVPATVERRPAHCEGTAAYNSFYGYGLINALRAVS